MKAIAYLKSLENVEEFIKLPLIAPTNVNILSLYLLQSARCLEKSTPRENDYTKN